MNIAEINILITLINETFNMQDGDYGHLKVLESFESGICKVIYGKTATLDFISETSYSDLTERLKIILCGIHSRIEAQNSAARDFVLDFDVEKAEPAFFSENAFSLKNITKFYEGCNLSEGLEYHVKNDAMAVIDSVTGEVIWTNSIAGDIKDILDSIKHSAHYFGVAENFKSLPPR